MTNRDDRHANRDEQVATDRRTDRQTDVPPTAVRGGAQVFAKEKAEVIASVSRALVAMSAAPLDARLKSILASQIGYLLRGGYSVDLIRSEALTLCHVDPQKLASIGAYVRAADARAREAEHLARRREEQAAPMDPATRDAIQAAIRARRRPLDVSDAECECKQLFRPDDRREPCKCGRYLHPVCAKRHVCDGRAVA